MLDTIDSHPSQVHEMIGLPSISTTKTPVVDESTKTVVLPTPTTSHLSVDSTPTHLSLYDMDDATKQRMFPDYKQHHRTVILVDGANVHAATYALMFQLDYSKLKACFELVTDVRSLVYFTAVPKDLDTKNVSQILVDEIERHRIGRVVQKPTKGKPVEQGGTGIKGNMDIELAVYALQKCGYADNIVLMTGDGDFKALVEAMQDRGQRVTVISTAYSRPSMVAEDLLRSCNHYLDLKDLKPYITRETDSSLKFDQPLRSVPFPPLLD